jgi:hypothetical protein
VTVLPALRRQGARRAWDGQIVIISQGLAIAATAIAIVAGNRFQTAAILLLFALAGAAITASERRTAFLLLPNLWGVGAIAATVALAGAGPRWAPSFYAGTGLVLALTLQGWRGVLSARRTDWFMAHRWSAGLWAASGPILGGWFLAEATAHSWKAGNCASWSSIAPTAGGSGGEPLRRRPRGRCGHDAAPPDRLRRIRRDHDRHAGWGSPDHAEQPAAYAVPLGIYLFASRSMSPTSAIWGRFACRWRTHCWQGRSR